MSAERSHGGRRPHEVETPESTEASQAAMPVPGNTVADALASFAGTRVATLGKARLPMPTETIGSDYDFPVANRERDRAIFAAALAASETLTRGFVEELDLLQEATDRVRWDRLVASGKYSGEYTSHNTPEEISDRANARNKMLDDPGNVAQFLPLISAKIAEMLVARKVVRTASTKTKSSSDALDL